MKPVHVIILLFFTWIIVLTGCTSQNTSSGRAIVSGTFIDSLIGGQNNSYVVITLSVPNIILGGMTDYQTTVKPDGSFSMEIPIVSPGYAAMNANSKIYDGLILISPGETTRLNLVFNEIGKINLRMLEGVELKQEDLGNIGNISNKVREAIVDGRNVSKLTMPFTQNARIDSMLIRIDKDLAIVYEDSILSAHYKNLLACLLKQFYLNGFFDNDNLNKSDYAFLRHFDLNNPPQLNDMYYSKNLRLILSNPALNIPRIGDTPIVNWQKEVKSILTDLTGINSGLFYDILAAESYINQLHDEMNPLSEKQKANIRTYFSNPSFGDILFAENKKIILQVIENEQNKQANLVVNETPLVDKDKLMDTIISKYKGKAVMVDFWGTWCVPCIQALNESKTLREKFSNKNIVFVYISGYSPKELWEKKIQEIGNEHYYLNKKEWESISNSKKYGFGGIPTYMLFDSSGKLKNKISGYPGNEKMQAMIEELLH